MLAEESDLSCLFLQISYFENLLFQVFEKYGNSPFDEHPASNYSWI